MTARPLAALLLVGCQHLDPFLPQVSFDRLDVTEVSFEDISAEFVFLVENPNPVQVELASYSYDIALEGVPLLSGTDDRGFALESRGRSELALPVDLVFAALWDTVQATRGEDVVDFTVAGHFGFDTPAGTARLPYDADGGFPALRTPKVSLDALRITHLDLLGVELALDLGIDNEHGSTLFFDDLGYAVQLNGQDLASGGVPSFDVAGASTGTVSLPIAIDLLSVGDTIVTAILDGGSLDVGLAADVDVGTPFGVIPLAIDAREGLRIE